MAPSNPPGTALVDRPTPSTARLVQWAPRSGTSSLVGYVTIAFGGGITIASIPVYRIGDKLSAGSPSMPELDRDGRARVGVDGKRVYVKIIKFEGNAAYERWNTAVLGALADAGIRL